MTEAWVGRLTRLDALGSTWHLELEGTSTDKSGKFWMLVQ
jgi:hypothetical protein